jgi:ribosomal protein L28
MHRAFKGLYGNRMIQFGNKVSFAENKSRRTWKPNVQVKSMYSETLQRMLRFRMTTHVMRCIKKAGGIDGYLMKAKDSELKYPRAIEYKRDMLAIHQELRRGAPGAGPSAGPGGPLSPSAPAAFRTSPSLGDSTADCVRTSRVLGLRWGYEIYKRDQEK